MLLLLLVLIFCDLSIFQLQNPQILVGSKPYSEKLAKIIQEFHSEFPHTTAFNDEFANGIRAMSLDEVLRLNIKDHLTEFKQANVDAILRSKIALAVRERKLYTYNEATMKFTPVRIAFDSSDQLLQKRQEEMYRIMLTSYQNTLREIAEHRIGDVANLEAYTKEFTQQATKILVTDKAELSRLIAAGKSSEQILSQKMNINPELFRQNAPLVGIADDMARNADNAGGRSSWLKGGRSLSRSQSSLGRLEGAAKQVEEHRKGNGMGAVLAVGAVAAVGAVGLIGASVLSRPDPRGPMMPPVGQMGMFK